VGTPVFVCRKCKGHACLTSFLDDVPELRVQAVGCQKVCKGAVVGLEVGGRMEWYQRVNRPKPMVALARLAQRGGTGKVAKPLAKRWVRKRSGRPPR
jgi:hypothetical protein